MHNDSLLRDSLIRPAAESPRPAARQGPGIALGVALAFVAGWSGLVGARAKILAAVPAVAPVYAALGLDASLRRISLGPVVSRLSEEEGRPILVVEGEIRNLAHGPQAAPRLKLAVIDAAGQALYTWTAAPAKSRLRGGETATFRARLAAPPAGGREVLVRLAGASERAGQGS